MTVVLLGGDRGDHGLDARERLRGRGIGRILVRFDVRDRWFCSDSLRFPLSAQPSRKLTTTILRANVEAANFARQPSLPLRFGPAVPCARDAVGGKPAGRRPVLV